MTQSNIKAVINSDIEKVWNTVLDVRNYHVWRSDLKKTDILNDKQFIEYTKDDYATTFTVTFQETYKRWEFDIENNNMKGHWIGIFTSVDNKTEIDFTEYVTVKNKIMKLFIKSYLKKQQALFVEDLRKALEK